MKKHLFFVAALTFVLLNNNCHGQIANSSEFKNGSLRLSASIFGKGASGSEKIKSIYDNKKWVELVEEVVSQKYVNDTYYFYLGEAASGLGYTQAAATYYKESINNSKSNGCSAPGNIFYDACQGFEFPEMAIQKLVKIDPSLRASFGLRSEADAAAIELKRNLLKFVEEFSKDSTIRYSNLNGPLLKDLGIEGIDYLANIVSIEAPVKDKFETDAQFQERVNKTKSGVKVHWYPLLVGSKHCPSTYEHAAKRYSIIDCKLASPDIELISQNMASTTERISNMSDSREIKVENRKVFKLNAKSSWSADFTINPAEAKSLEQDLRVAVFTKDPYIIKTCPSCETQKYYDETKKEFEQKLETARLDRNLGLAAIHLQALNDLEKTNPRREAFLTGQRTEVFIETVSGASISRLIVYQGSSGRIFFDTARKK